MGLVFQCQTLGLGYLIWGFNPSVIMEDLLACNIPFLF